MESIFSRNGTLGQVENVIGTPEGKAGKDTPVGRALLDYVTYGLYSAIEGLANMYKGKGNKGKPVEQLTKGVEVDSGIKSLGGDGV